MGGYSSGPRSIHNKTHARCIWHGKVSFSRPFTGAGGIASELLVFGGCKYRKQVWSWTILHARSLYIYQTLMFECLSGVVCLVEKVCFSQPLWTLRMGSTTCGAFGACGTFIFYLFFSEHIMSSTHCYVPVLTPCRIWWILKHNLSVNNRCLVLFLLLRGRSECGCAERVVLYE